MIRSVRARQPVSLGLSNGPSAVGARANIGTRTARDASKGNSHAMDAHRPLLRKWRLLLLPNLRNLN
eukprot:1788978-Pleurochrysis_carterae.AAC.1